MDIDARLEQLLPQVRKPMRYLGNEWNSVHKNHGDVAVRAVLAFPDLYEIGMSNLGLKILYAAVNRRQNMLLERVFAPAADMEELLRRYHIPLFALESRVPVKDFDLVGFSLQYELSYTNVLNMLHLSRIPLYSRERDEGDPLVAGGGPCAYNPEPLAPFFDFFLLGDGETALPEILNLMAALKGRHIPRKEILTKLAALPGVYVPSFYEPVYANGTLQGMEILNPKAPPVIRKAVVKDLDRAPYPTAPLVPYMEVVHDRGMLELFRGCNRGCRFCQAGIVYRPLRRRSHPVLRKLGRKILESTGYEEISLASLSSSDYPHIEELISDLTADFPAGEVYISLPSLRLDSFSVGLAGRLHSGRLGTLTFAPEVATPRMQEIVNKHIPKEDLFKAIGEAVNLGWRSFKLYFMLGLPGERDEDVEEIAYLCREIRDRFREAAGSRLRITASVATFIPKAHTPFQWEPQLELDRVAARQHLLQQRFRRIRGLQLHWHDAESSFLEAVFARGDRRLAPVVEAAWRCGCRFDSWSDYFSLERWQEAFREAGVSAESYAYRRFAYEEILPWDHLEAGAPRELLIREHRKALPVMREPEEGGRPNESSGKKP